MKGLKIFLVLVLMSSLTFSQSIDKDLLILKSGDEIQCTITTILDASTTFTVNGKVDYVTSNHILAYKLKPNEKPYIQITQQELPDALIEKFKTNLDKSEKYGKIGGLCLGFGLVGGALTALTWNSMDNGNLNGVYARSNERFIWMGISALIIPGGNI